MSVAGTVTPQEDVQRLPTRDVVRRLFSYYRGRAGQLAWMLACHIVVISLDLSGPMLLGFAIQEMREGVTGASVSAWLVLFFALVMVKNVFRFMRGRVNVRLGMDIITDYRKQLHQKSLDLSFRYHDDTSVGTLLTRGTRDLEKISAVYFEMAVNGIESFLFAAGTIAYLAWIHWQLGLIGGVVYGLTVLAILSWSPTMRRKNRAVSDSYDGVSTAIQENVAGVRVVKAFGREPREIERFGAGISAYKAKDLAAGRFFTMVMPLSVYTFHVAIPLVIVVGGKLVLAGTVALGHLWGAVYCLTILSNRIRPLSRIFEIAQQAISSADRFYAVVDQDVEIKAPEKPVEFPRGAGSFEFDHVHFQYVTGKEVLHNMTFAVTGGETIGVVGSTGCGKTTVASLLARFYDVAAGRILFDGVDIRYLDPVELRRHIAVVYQDTFLFSASIEDNIRLARPEATEADVVEAARAARIHEFVLTLKDGYKTQVGERGISLSGGQKQRVAIARAFLARPRVLILDDATSSVDARTEKALQAEISRFARAATTVIISQRISAVMDCDRILVLDGGRLAQSGTHAELMGGEGLYRDMVESQFEEAAGA